MARTIRLKAPKSIALRKMSADEIGKTVLREADKALEQMPAETRPIGVNAVSLESFEQAGADTGFWAEWTRACCDRRNRIEEFVDPVEKLTEGAIRTGAAELDNALNIQRVLIGKTHTERLKE